MDARLKAKWVEALRSGEYQQGRGKLRDGMSFCCLGVLCEVAGVQIDDKGMWPVNVDHRPGYDLIWKLVGGEKRNLPEMNDKGRSFKQLADYIEENL